MNISIKWLSLRLTKLQEGCQIFQDSSVLNVRLFVFCLTFRRALAMFNYEERSKRENKILSDFREMIHQKINNKK